MMKKYKGYIEEVRTLKIKVSGENLKDAELNIKDGKYDEVVEINRKVKSVRNTLRLDKVFKEIKHKRTRMR